MKTKSRIIKKALCGGLAFLTIFACCACSGKEKTISDKDLKNVKQAVTEWFDGEKLRLCESTYADAFYSDYSSGTNWTHINVYAPDDAQDGESEPDRGYYDNTPAKKMKLLLKNSFALKEDEITADSCKMDEKNEICTVAVVLDVVDFERTLDVIRKGRANSGGAHRFQNKHMVSDSYPCEMSKTFDECIALAGDDKEKQDMVKSAFIIDYLAYGEKAEKRDAVLHVTLELKDKKWTVTALNGQEISKENGEKVLEKAIKGMFNI